MTTARHETGRYGRFGGRYVPEILVPALTRLEETSRLLLDDPGFLNMYEEELSSWVGRPTALTHADRLGDVWGGELWLKREDLAHTGAHKINNACGSWERRCSR